MAKLINGNGNPAVYANEDSDWFAAIMGNQTSITAIGEQFRADQADANTIEVFDGVIITKEGRRIQLDANQVDLFEIPTGTQGQTNYYIIGYHLYTDTDANQFCEVFVQLMESASDTIPEDTFRGGADDVYISLYRVTQDGLNIDSIDLLLPTISTISKINADLSDIGDEINKVKKFGTIQTILESQIANGFAPPTDGFLTIAAESTSSVGYYLIASSDITENVVDAGEPYYARLNIFSSGIGDSKTFPVTAGNTYTKLTTGGLSKIKFIFRPLHS